METEDKDLANNADEQNPGQESPDTETAAGNEPDTQTDQPGEQEGSSVEKALDKLEIETEDDVGDTKKADDGDRQNAPDGKTAAEPQPAQKTAPAPANPAAKLTLEQEEAELVRSIPSERGRTRITQLLSQGRQARSSLASIQRLVSDSGLDQESLSVLLNISKAISSGNPAAVSQGLQQFERVRANLYRQVGQEAPGVDLIARYNDLQKRVTEMGMKREDALEIAKARQIEENQRAYAQQEAQMRAERQQFEGNIRNFQQQTLAAFAARQNDPDFEARIEVMKKHFTQERIQEFVKRVPPERWMDSILYIYDNTNPAPRKANNVITGRPSRAAGVKTNGTVPASREGIAARMAQMGL